MSLNNKQKKQLFDLVFDMAIDGSGIDDLRNIREERDGLKKEGMMITLIVAVICGMILFVKLEFF